MKEINLSSFNSKKLIYTFWYISNIKFRKVKDFKYLKNASKEKPKEEVSKEDIQKEESVTKEVFKDEVP